MTESTETKTLKDLGPKKVAKMFLAGAAKGAIAMAIGAVIGVAISDAIRSENPKTN